MASTPSEGRQVWQFFWVRIREHKKTLILSLFFALAYSASQVLVAQLTKSFTNQVMLSSGWNPGVVQTICLSLIGIVVLMSVGEFFHKYLLRRALEKMAQKLRGDIFTHYLTLSESVRARLDSGKAINHVVSDVQLLNESRNFITEVVKEPLTLLGLLAYLFYSHWKLCLICAAAVIPIAIINKLIGSSARRNQARVQARLAEMIHSTNENFQGLRTVQTMLLERPILKQFKDLMSSMTLTVLKISKLEECVGPSTKIVSALIGAVLVYVGIYFVKGPGIMTMGDLTSFVVAAGLLQNPLRNLSQASVHLQRISIGAQRIWELFELPIDQLTRDQQELIKSDQEVRIPKTQPGLEFNGVSFQYPKGTQPAVQNISFKLESGKKLALVGKSGSGKSTLSLLTLRLMDPVDGNVKLGNINARDWNLADYRSHFSYVSQEVFFFQGTLRENLLRAAPGASDVKIWEALQLAQLKTRIEAMPEKLDSLLAEKAANLSGGEKQRLAIARALLREAPILIFDEATSALDSENERLIQEGMKALLAKNSAIIIAHRLSTVMNCDHVIVLDQGKICEQGSPDDLLHKEDSHFKHLWNLQQGLA